MKELGSSEAFIQGIRTVVDGSIRITLDLNPQSEKLIQELLKLKLKNNQSVFVGFAVDE